SASIPITTSVSKSFEAGTGNWERGTANRRPPSPVPCSLFPVPCSPFPVPLSKAHVRTHPARNRQRTRPLHHRPARRQARRGGGVAQPLAAHAAAGGDAQRDHA